MDDMGKVTKKEGIAEEVAYAEKPFRDRALRYQESDPDRAQMQREDAEAVGDETLEQIAKEKAESSSEQLLAVFSNLEKNLVSQDDKDDMAVITLAIKEIEEKVLKNAERWASRGLNVTPEMLQRESYLSDIPVANLDAARVIEYRMDSIDARDRKGEPRYRLRHTLPREGQLEMLRELGVLGSDEGFMALGMKGSLSSNKVTRYLETKIPGVQLVWTTNYGAELHLGPDYFTKMLEKLK